MSISIKTILKLICLLGLFSCTSQSVSAQDTVIELGDINRTGGGGDGEGDSFNPPTNPNGNNPLLDATISFHYFDSQLIVTLDGLTANDLNQFELVDLSGQRYDLLANQTGTHSFQITLNPQYYVMILETQGIVFTHNIHLQP